MMASNSNSLGDIFSDDNTMAGADPGIGSGGGPKVRAWQGVSKSGGVAAPGRCGRGVPLPSRPARGSGGAL